MPDGILNLDKPRGPTSHDVVSRVRRVTNVRRVGHAGTLDPLATGVLLVCIGRATRVSEYLMAGQKVYRAQVHLGVTTDTYDAEGQIVEEAPVDASRIQVETALAQFQGTISQVPPMYSAIKRQGKPLYRLARQGIEVQREPRLVEVYRLELTDWEPPLCTLEVACSSGTYVRALAHDLGQALGYGAHLADLTRLASGGFRVEDAVTLDAFTQAVEEGSWAALLHPLDAALGHLPALNLDADDARRLCAGQPITLPGPLPKPKGETLARAYGPDGTFLALATFDVVAGVWRPHKVFA
jgi:tRNA pseudouridine55 synthase